ncbi:Bodo-specific multi-copy gene family, putative [Bodo saltans]|uniref:Bodo-specific multi-copy gene family, putative n=1 Tax=Bodo saltans TaxID=75058 RepID=A0A0S4IJB4_BODSA|nr:Bodo-specific multi-copy gene family, putative [Bodo saltans]|eukprot:CUE78570.1 Bodo-specific multi-copy gene family, putative [Bodo saltans]
METEVNLSYERAFKNALTYQGSSAHHDAYIWCRKKTNVDATSAVPLQLRHRQAKIEKKRKEAIGDSQRLRGLRSISAVREPTRATALHEQRIERHGGDGERRGDEQHRLDVA